MTVLLLQAQLGRRHSPGFPLPPYQPEKLNASRSDSIPEEAVLGNEEGHMGPMGSREVLLQVCGLLAALLSNQFFGQGHVTESMSLYAVKSSFSMPGFQLGVCSACFPSMVCSPGESCC